MIVLGYSGLHTSVEYKKRLFPNLEKRKYRIVQGLDSAAALVSENGILAAAAEERFNGEKGTNVFPVNAIHACLSQAGLNLEDITHVAHGFCYTPLREQFYAEKNMREQYEDVYSLDVQLRLLKNFFPKSGLSSKLIQVPHHLAHAASTYYLSGFDRSLILVTDGMGESHSMTVATGAGKNIEIIYELPAIHSLGILYGIATLYLGFVMAMDEYKVMGLAPYGDPNRYFDKMNALVQLQDGGTYTIPILAEDKTREERETHEGVLKKLESLFGPRREPGTELTQQYKDFAGALQAVLQNTLLHTLNYFKRVTKEEYLCMAGGVALNCCANGVIKRSHLFKDIFVQPAAGDDGTALGAALYVLGRELPDQQFENMHLPLWGPSYNEKEIQEAFAQRTQIRSRRFDSFETLADEVARRIADGEVFGWFQGRMEFGPRALGSRSILADPRDPNMRNHINRLVKKREGFRPFAPAVKLEAAPRLFHIAPGEFSLYNQMLCVTHVHRDFRSALPAVTHVDGSARAQIVVRDENPRFWTILDSFEKLTGMPVLLNTSFNVRGQPIVCSPIEAIDTFLAANLSGLVLENYLVEPVEGSQAG